MLYAFIFLNPRVLVCFSLFKLLYFSVDVNHSSTASEMTLENVLLSALTLVLLRNLRSLVEAIRKIMLDSTMQTQDWASTET
jgi:type IV secretory pathway TrbF-like protein